MEAVARLEVRRAACRVAATAPGLAVAATVASRAARPEAAQVEVGMAAALEEAGSERWTRLGR